MFLFTSRHNFIYMTGDIENKPVTPADAARTYPYVGEERDSGLSEASGDVDVIASDSSLERQEIAAEMTRSSIDMPALIDGNYVIAGNNGRTVEFMRAIRHPDRHILNSFRSTRDFLEIVKRNSSNGARIDYLMTVAAARFQIDDYDKSIDNAEINAGMHEIDTLIEQIKHESEVRHQLDGERTSVYDDIVDSSSRGLQRIWDNYASLPQGTQTGIAAAAVVLGLVIALHKGTFASKTRTLLKFGAIAAGGLYALNVGAQIFTGETAIEGLASIMTRSKRNLGRYYGLDPDNEIRAMELDSINSLMGINHSQNFRGDYSFSQYLNAGQDNDWDNVPFKHGSHFDQNEGSGRQAYNVIMEHFGPGSRLYSGNEEVRDYMDDALAGRIDASPRDALYTLVGFDTERSSIILTGDEQVGEDEDVVGARDEDQSSGFRGAASDVSDWTGEQIQAGGDRVGASVDGLRGAVDSHLDPSENRTEREKARERRAQERAERRTERRRD